MNFNAPLLRPIRILLFPFSLVYALVVWIRNLLFDKNFFSTTSFNLPVICIGNLSVGGTGKSTMVEFIAGRFHRTLPLAIISRGYKRKTQGYALANERSTALEIGDEPMQFHIKFPDVAVAVGEERIVAIPQVLHDRPETRLILLDDAFQHRSVKAGLNILLTEYNNLFTRDWFLPTGDLRDERRSYKRADLLVVTKCPPELSQAEARSVEEELAPEAWQQVFFSSIRYGTPYHISRHHTLTINNSVEVLLVSGIANPGPLKEYLHEYSRTYYEMLYSDHHIFTIDDWKEIIKRYDSIQAPSKIILTTEKDAVRLSKFTNEVKDIPLFVMPIEMQLLFNSEERFTGVITSFINKYNLKK
jgi:tetraacyldisaccharide 4'-kinase